MEATTNKQVHLPSLVLWIMQRRCASIIKFGRGRSIKKFCEDEGYDYWQVLQTGGEREIRIRFSDPVCNAMKIYEKITKGRRNPHAFLNLLSGQGYLSDFFF